MNGCEKNQGPGPLPQVYGLLPAVCGLLSVVCGLILAGCSDQQRGRTQIDPEPLCLANVEKAVAMEAAEDVLAKMHFVIVKADVEAGLIRTRPLSGAQFFEFWRKDSVGGFNKTEANLHSIRRTAELQIRRKGEQICIDCLVRTQRLNLPEFEVSGSARAYEMFSVSKGSLQTLEIREEQEEGLAWVDLGNDGRLAAEVLGRIKRQISQLAKDE